MSLKYQRVKQNDLLLPAPLRWLTRAFSSITLAVSLLLMVMLYGLIASVPLGLLALAGLYLANALACAAILAAAARFFIRVRGAWLVIPVLLGVAASSLPSIQAYQWLTHTDWFALHKAMVIYRLPYFEMTELEFYSWWPLKLILCLFMLNLIWATIRRIEFKLVNVGVLTVHTGIITLGVGSILYGAFKVEGDTLLWRKDLGGGPVDVFYDATTAAVYFDLQTPTALRHLMLELPGLPRYNDYDPGTLGGGGSAVRPGALNIRLDRRPEFAAVLGDRLHAVIPGFYAYGQLDPVWVESHPDDPQAPPAKFNPAMTITIGPSDKDAADFTTTLVAGVPGQRAASYADRGIEFLSNPTDQRIKDLNESFEGDHGMIVEIPEPPGSPAFRAVYSITPGQVIDVGHTGYRLTIEDVGPYGMSFASRGYEGAVDTRAMVRVERDGQTLFRRIVMYRYPEASQDFVPQPPGTPGVGPMGKRTAPSAAMRLTYIDASKPQFHLISYGEDLDRLALLVRIPGHAPLPEAAFNEDSFPVGIIGGNECSLRITRRMTCAAIEMTPHITPRENRMPKEEGTYVSALLPVDLSIDLPASADQPAHTWRKRLWLTHMRYPVYPDDIHHPQVVDVPEVGRVTVSFSRERLLLPFALTLDNFEMDPYPGTDIPRDFRAGLHLDHLAPDGNLDGQTFDGSAHLNNPLVIAGLSWSEAMKYPGGFFTRLGYYGRLSNLKFSQTGWDPGEKRDPRNNDKNAAGLYVNQQRFTILGVGSNFAIHVIFVGARLMALGIPMAFYLKPVLVQRQKRKIQRELAEAKATGAKDRRESAKAALRTFN